MYNNKRMIGKAHYDVATVDCLVLNGRLIIMWKKFDRSVVDCQIKKTNKLCNYIITVVHSLTYFNYRMMTLVYYSSLLQE